MAKLFDVRGEGNYREEATGRLIGKNVLHLKRPLVDGAREMEIPEPELKELEAARQKLFSAREGRVRPSKDDKVLADWNGLMVASLARGAQVLDDEELEEAASRAADFVLAKMRDGEGRLLHRYRKGSSGILGNLDDYAFLIWGLIELYEAGFKTKYLRAALDLARDLVSRFEDDEDGGFYFTPVDGEDLILRKKDGHDGALPSGNAVAVLDLLRLSRMTGDSKLQEVASRAFDAFAAQARGFPVPTFTSCRPWTSPWDRPQRWWSRDERGLRIPKNAEGPEVEVSAKIGGPPQIAGLGPGDRRDRRVYREDGDGGREGNGLCMLRRGLHVSDDGPCGDAFEARFCRRRHLEQKSG